MGFRQPNTLDSPSIHLFPRGGSEGSRGGARGFGDSAARLVKTPPPDSSPRLRRPAPPQDAAARRLDASVPPPAYWISLRWYVLASPPFPSSSRVCHRPWLLPLPPEVPVVNQVVGDDVGLGAVVAGLVVEVEQHGAASTSLCLNLPSTSVSVDRLRICTC